MTLEPYLTSYIKTNWKWIKYLNVRAKMIKHLEENIDINCYDLEFGNVFLDVIPKTQVTKEKIDKLDLIKSKRYVCINILILVIKFHLSILFYVCHNNPRIHLGDPCAYFHDHCLSFIMCNRLAIFYDE